MGDLNTLLPDVIVQAGGEEVTVRAFRFKEIPRVSGYVWEAARNAGTEADAEDPDLMSLLAEGGDALVKILALATDKPPEWFDDLPAADGLRLLEGLLEVNEDFFGQLFSGKLLGVATEVLLKVLTGAKSRSSSPPTATVTPKS